MKKKKILIIDDEKDFSELVGFILNQTGHFEAYSENDPVAGFSSAKKLQPDLILLDVMMPSMSGDEVAQILKKDRTTKDIPIVFLTAAATKEEVKQHEGFIGGYPFMSKSIRPDELIDLINENIR